MKTVFRIIASLVVLGGMAACQQFKIDTQLTPEKAAANIKLECDALPAYSVPALNPEDVTFNITANTPWTIITSSGADWCTVSPSSSSASALISDVTVKMESNTGLEERSVTLTIKGDNISVAKSITITQGKNGQLYVTPVAQNYSAVGGPLNFTLNTNVAWEVRSNASWISFNRESGNPDPEGRTITVVAIAEPSNVMERVATITVIAGDDEESFDVTQMGTFDLTAIGEPFPGEGGSQAILLRTDLPWTVTSSVSWLTFDKQEGTGDGKSLKITATATANDSNNRKATVTVKAGGAEKSFEVIQKGASFEIVAPASTQLDRGGATLTLTVNADQDWSVECNVEGWTVEKVDASHIKVTAPWNNKFGPLNGTVAITGGNLRDEITLTQDANFTLSGHYDLLDDGSVKIYNDEATKVTTVDNFRFLKMTLTLGDVNFVDNGRLWVVTKGTGDTNIYNQVTLGGNVRLRTDGSLGSDGSSTYNNAKYTLTKDELNQLKKYQFNILPDPNDARKHIMQFFYNDEASPRAELNSLSGIADDPNQANPYWFGVASEDLVANGTWYVVKSCDIVPVEG